VGGIGLGHLGFFQKSQQQAQFARSYRVIIDDEQRGFHQLSKSSRGDEARATVLAFSFLS
jgi:hypothetical protein